MTEFYLTPSFKEQNYTKKKGNISRIDAKEFEKIMRGFERFNVHVMLERPYTGKFAKTAIAAARALEAEPPSRPRWVSVFPRPVLAAAFATVLVVATSTATLWVARPLQPASEELGIRAIAERVRARDGVGEMRADLDG